MARDFASRVRHEGYDELAQLATLLAALADVTVTTVIPIADSGDGPGAEPPGVLTIRRVIESCEALALDDEDDREALVCRLAAALGIA
jgi:hypothetical protein